MVMWDSKFSKQTYELVISRIGKKDYNKEITNLILTKIDMETTFCHHLLPDAWDYLTSLFGSIRGYESMFSNLDILKRYYRDGEKYKAEYLEYLEELGASNEHDSFLRDFALERERNGGPTADYIEGVINVYHKYRKTNMLNIIKLEDRIAVLKKEYDALPEEEVESLDKKGKKRISKILDYFKRV